jgi:hypothetical protein
MSDRYYKERVDDPFGIWRTLIWIGAAWLVGGIIVAHILWSSA